MIRFFPIGRRHMWQPRRRLLSAQIVQAMWPHSKATLYFRSQQIWHRYCKQTLCSLKPTGCSEVTSFSSSSYFVCISFTNASTAAASTGAFLFDSLTTCPSKNFAQLQLRPLQTIPSWDRPAPIFFAMFWLQRGHRFIGTFSTHSLQIIRWPQGRNWTVAGSSSHKPNAHNSLSSTPISKDPPELFLKLSRNSWLSHSLIEFVSFLYCAAPICTSHMGSMCGSSKRLRLLPITANRSHPSKYPKSTTVSPTLYTRKFVVVRKHLQMLFRTRSSWATRSQNDLCVHFS